MEHYGIEMKGEFICEKVSSNPSWTASDEGRLIYNLSDGYYYYGSDVAWVKFAKNSDLTSHSTSNGTDHANVVLNDTHRGSNGTDHANVVLNDTHRGSNGTDHGYIDQDVSSGASPNLDGSNFTNIDTFPSGGIIMWSGTIANIPSGWYICDGNNSTPNLTDRFVIHADADAAGTNNVGDSGGSNTIAEGQLPSHDHFVVSSSQSSSTSLTNSNHLSYRNQISSDLDYHLYGVGSTPSVGKSSAIGSGNDYKPKYYALAYIMKG